jgi:hypothetical protein
LQYGGTTAGLISESQVLTRERVNADARFHELAQDNVRLQREAQASDALASEREREAEALRTALKEAQLEKEQKQQFQRRESVRSVELSQVWLWLEGCVSLLGLKGLSPQELRDQREELVRLRVELARKEHTALTGAEEARTLHASLDSQLQRCRELEESLRDKDKSLFAATLRAESAERERNALQERVALLGTTLEASKTRVTQLADISEKAHAAEQRAQLAEERVLRVQESADRRSEGGSFQVSTKRLILRPHVSVKKTRSEQSTTCHNFVQQRRSICAEKGAPLSPCC